MRLRVVERTGSTNADVLSDAQVVEGDWLIALEQEGGKGRHGRSWVSAAGNFFGSTLVVLRRGDPSAQTLSLAAGLALSFTVLGLFIALIGFAIGLDAGVFRVAAAVIIIAFGVVLLVPAWQTRLAAAGGPLANWADRHFGAASSGLGGQFGVGLLLGAVWSPCVGPTLGAASILASQGKDLWRVALTMAVFGIGAALPLIAQNGIETHEASAAFMAVLKSRVGFFKDNWMADAKARGIDGPAAYDYFAKAAQDLAAQMPPAAKSPKQAE